MAEKNVNLDVNIDVKSNVGPSIAKLKELKKELKAAAAGSDDFKKISAQIRDTEDALDGAKKGADDFMGSLEGASGPLGMAARGLKKLETQFSTLGGALKATGIGLLVSLLGGLVAAFSQNETAMKKLQPVFDALQKVLGGIFRAFEPVLDIFVELALDVLPYFTKGIEIVYSSLFALFKFIKEVATGYGKIIKGIFTLDADSITDGIKQIGNSFGETVKSYKETSKRFQEGSKELTESEKEEIEKRQAAEKEAAEKRKKAAEEELARRKGDLDAKIQLEIDKENTSKEALEKLLDERFKAEIQGQKLSDAQKQLLRSEYSKKVIESLKADKEAREKDFQEQVSQLKNAGTLQLAQLQSNLDSFKVLYGENSVEVTKTQDEIYAVQQKGLDDERNLINSKIELTSQDKDRIQSIAIEEQKLTTAIEVENKRRNDYRVASYLKAQDEQKKANDARYAEEMKASGNDFTLQQELLDAKIEADRLYYETLLAQANLSKDQLKVIQDQQTANTKANATAQVDIESKKFGAQMAMLDATANAISAVSDIVGKSTKAGKALAVAASLISTYTAIAKQLSAFAGVPVPGYAIVQAVATGLVGFKAVRDIISTPIPTEDGGTTTPSTSTGPSVAKPRGLARGGYVSGTGSGTSDSIPAMLSNGESVINAASTAMFAPLLSTINQMGGGRQFALGGMSSSLNQSQVINSMSNMDSMAPIKTYVLSSDISNQMAFDRAIKSRSTI